MHGGNSSEGPPPEWVSVIKVAERMYTQPWVIDDDERVTPYEWSNRVLTLMSCEAEAHKLHQQRAESKQRIGRVRSGKGRFQ